MAKIKLSGGKVVTKNGKPACSCCEALCCMYPAIGIHLDLFTAADLPDEILWGDIDNLDELLFPFEKQGNAYYSTAFIGEAIDGYPSPPPYPPGTIRFAIFNRGGATWPDQQKFDFHIVWRTEELVNGTWQGFAPLPGFKNWLTETAEGFDPIVRDRFARSYLISGPHSDTVRRPFVNPYDYLSDNCRWYGDSMTLRYNGFINETYETGKELIGNFKWQVRGPDGIWRNKSDLQNTPVGSYAGGYTVS